jgi:hypothetical protein
MTIRQLKPRQLFNFNGIPLIVRCNTLQPDGKCCIRVRLDGHDGRVYLPANARASDYAEKCFPRNRKKIKTAATGKTPLPRRAKPC